MEENVKLVLTCQAKISWKALQPNLEWKLFQWPQTVAFFPYLTSESIPMIQHLESISKTLRQQATAEVKRNKEKITDNMVMEFQRLEIIAGNNK